MSSIVATILPISAERSPRSLTSWAAASSARLMRSIVWATRCAPSSAVWAVLRAPSAARSAFAAICVAAEATRSLTALVSSIALACCAAPLVTCCSEAARLSTPWLISCTLSACCEVPSATCAEARATSCVARAASSATCASCAFASLSAAAAVRVSDSVPFSVRTMRWKARPSASRSDFGVTRTVRLPPAICSAVAAVSDR